jgi:phage terminase large subunit-like protein
VNRRASGRSPDRLDALVWAVTELTAPVRPGPRIRSLGGPTRPWRLYDVFA